MDENRIDRGGGSGSAADLSPILRRAVEKIVRDSPPEDVSSRALAAARQIGLSHRAAAAGLRRRRMAWRVFCLAASVALAVASAWWYWSGLRDGQVAIQPPPVGPGSGWSSTEDPQIAPADHPPSLWAYREAAAQSMEAFEAMLDQDAHCVLRPEPQPFHAAALFGAIRQTL